MSGNNIKVSNLYSPWSSYTSIITPLSYRTDPRSYVGMFLVVVLGCRVYTEPRFRPMNRMEVEARSEECIDYDESGTTVSMKNATSLGES